MIFFPYPMGKPLFLPDGGGIRDRGLVRFWYPGSILEHSSLLMAATNRIANLVNRTPSHEGAREVTVRLMREYAKRFEMHGAQLAVIILPHAGDQPSQSKADTRYVVERLHMAGIRVLVPQFPRLPNGHLDEQRFLIPSDSVHPNAEYNRLLAEQAADFLRHPEVSRLP
jgi:hypothetical protein